MFFHKNCFLKPFRSLFLNLPALIEIAMTGEVRYFHYFIFALLGKNCWFT